jgi:hypothetical protein
VSAPRLRKDAVRPRRLIGASGRPPQLPCQAAGSHERVPRIDVGKSWSRPALVVGATPLLVIVVAADLGLLRDPNPNPVGPGILFGLTLWPAIICVVVGVIRVRSRRAG